MQQKENAQPGAVDPACCTDPAKHEPDVSPVHLTSKAQAGRRDTFQKYAKVAADTTIH